MELNLVQDLVIVDQDPLFLVFLDLRKAYDKLDHGRLLKTQERYRVGPKIRIVLLELWAWQEVVTQKNGCHDTQFRATRRTTQGGLILPTLFNVLIYNVVRHWLSMTVEYDTVIHNGLGRDLGQSVGVFYLIDVIIGLQDPEWQQGAFDILIGLFFWIVLMASAPKSKTMMCQPGKIRS